MIHAYEIHPALVHFPIVFLMTGVALDLFAAWRPRAEYFRYATASIVAGALSLVPTAAAGFLAFFTVPAIAPEGRDLMLWHMGLNVVAFACWAGIAWFRWKNRPAIPSNLTIGLGALVLATTLVSSFIGGTLVYCHGAGVNPEILSPVVRAENGAHPAASQH